MKIIGMSLDYVYILRFEIIFDYSLHQSVCQLHIWHDKQHTPSLCLVVSLLIDCLNSKKNSSAYIEQCLSVVSVNIKI